MVHLVWNQFLAYRHLLFSREKSLIVSVRLSACITVASTGRVSEKFDAENFQGSLVRVQMWL